MTPEEIQKINELISEHDKAPEPHSWKKFFAGFFTGQNYLKAIVFGVCFLIIATIVFSVFNLVKAKIAPKQATISTVSGGNVDVSVNKKVKNSILGIF